MKNKYNIVDFDKAKKKDFISIIIPVYKDYEGLKDTLKSLKKQNFNRSKFEIIVVNDGGDENIRKICKGYKVKCIDIIPRKGSYNARNEGLKVSGGEYVAFIDADIKAPKDWVQSGFNLLQKYDYVGGRVEIDKTKLKMLAHYYEYLTAFDNKEKLRKNHYIPTANLFVKRKVIEKIGAFDKRLYSNGDLEFGNRVYISNEFTMYYDSDLYVVHPPRGKQKLIQKTIRTYKGSKNLSNLYQERFKNLKPPIRVYLKIILFPLYKVITSKRKISLNIRLKLIFWSIYFGFYRLIGIIKN